MSLLRSLAILEEQTQQAAAEEGASARCARDVAGRRVAVAALGKHDQVFPRLMVA